MKSVLKKIIAISKKKIKTAPDLKRIRLSDITKNCVNSTKIKKLGWQPKISLEKTLKDTYRSFLI
jgi:nucleoside-diphosphate-sugar epimerase